MHPGLSLASEVFVKLFAPRRQDKFLSVLCGKYDVSVHADVAHCRTCRWNLEGWHLSGYVTYFLDAIRRCRFAQPTANGFEPLRGAIGWAPGVKMFGRRIASVGVASLNLRLIALNR